MIEAIAISTYIAVLAFTYAVFIYQTILLSRIAINTAKT